MKNIIYKYIRLTLLIVILLSAKDAAFAQWSNDPSMNLAVCNASGEQALTKISPTNDGGCYISWFDNRNGSYAVYLQRLNVSGIKQFEDNGLLISNNPQNSSLVDYDLTTDQSDNAILVFTDKRNGSQINPFAYKISPAGQFLWGNNGVALSDSFNVYQANPKVALTNDGNYVFVWLYASTPRKVCMQKLNAAGAKQWGNNIYLSSGTTELYDWPWHIASDSGSVIVMWSGYTGSFLSPQNYKIYSQKFSSSGAPVWNSTQDTVYNLGKVSGFYTPRIFSDGNNGAIYVWQDDRNSTNSTNSFVQRKNSSGAILFPANGSACGITTSDALRFTPIAAAMPSTNETYVFWQHKNSLQSLIGVYGQKFSSTGTRQWTEDGIAFKPMDGNSFSSLAAITKNEQVMVYYLEILPALSANIKAFSVSRTESFLWGGGIFTPSSNPSEKIRMSACMNSSGMSMLSWQDNRNGAGDIYAQNINLDGTIPVELNSFTASVNDNSVVLNWKTASEKNNLGFEIEKSIGTQSSLRNWDALAFINGAGTTVEEQNYFYSDNQLSNGKYLYRLKQIDFDGSVSYSNEVEVDVNLLNEYSLDQNYPNPFNPSAVIKYALGGRQHATLKVFDILGNEVATLVNEMKDAGAYEVEWNASSLPSGIYFYTLRTSSFTQTKQMLLLK